ncbi:MAG: helix-turn-helix domain-containing protein [Candidatus Sumerlaeota bacterium]
MSMYALEVLQHFSSSGQPVSRGYIAEKTSIPRSTMTRVLANLVSDGYLEKVAHGQYVAGPHFEQMIQNEPQSRMPSQQKTFAFLFRESVTACQPVWQGINDVLNQYNMRCILHPVGWCLDEAQEDANSILRDMDGAFFFTFQPLQGTFLEWVRHTGKPGVHLGWSSFDCCDVVTWDMAYGIRLLAEEALRQGCKKILYICGESMLIMQPFAIRHQSYKNTMESLGMEPMILNMEPGSFYKVQIFRERIMKYSEDLSESDRIAFILSHDSIAQPLAMTLDTIGKNFREQTLLASPLLTSGNNQNPQARSELDIVLLEPWVEAGRVAARRMFSRMTGDTTEPNLSMVQPRVSMPAGNQA